VNTCLALTKFAMKQMSGEHMSGILFKNAGKIMEMMILIIMIMLRRITD